MRRFFVGILLAFAILVTSTHAANPPVFTSDFESGLTGWQTKHLLPGDGVKCKDGNCYFQWSKAVTVQNRVLRAIIPYTGAGGQLLGLTGEFTVDPGARLYVRVKVPGEKIYCKHIAQPAAEAFRGFTCAGQTASAYNEIRVKISSAGGGRIRADNIEIAILYP